MLPWYKYNTNLPSIEKVKKRPLHQPDIWGLTKGMLHGLNILLIKYIPCLVQQNVGLVRSGLVVVSLHKNLAQPSTTSWNLEPYKKIDETNTSTIVIPSPSR
jgi:hypothetical protein